MVGNRIFEMAELSRYEESPDFRLEFERLLDCKLLECSLESEKIPDPEISPVTKLIKCYGTAAFKCNHKNRTI